MKMDGTHSESLLAFVESNAGPDAPITILIVDDDEDCRSLLRDAISECSIRHRVVECANGAEAMEYLNAHRNPNDEGKPGLIFLDVEIPRMNGLEMLSVLRKDERLREIPVVMMTGVADEEVIRRAAQLGANSYTIKPARAEEFLKTVLTSTNYWLTIHQYPARHLSQEASRR
jgi:two-component system, response regulator